MSKVTILVASFTLTLGSRLLTIFVGMINQDFENFKDECVEQLSAVQEEFMKVYDINSYEHWYYDHGIGAFHVIRNISDAPMRYDLNRLLKLFSASRLSK